MTYTETAVTQTINRLPSERPDLDASSDAALDNLDQFQIGAADAVDLLIPTAYYAVPGNTEAVSAFRYHLTQHWFQALRRRSQRTWINWTRMNRIATRWLPQVRVMHPFPAERFAART